MRQRRARSQREIDGLTAEGMFWVADNLYIQIRKQGTRSWLFRYWVRGNPKVVGLGATREVTLAEARDKAERLRIAIRDGADPAAEKQKVREAQRGETKVPTFAECARTYIAAHEASWKNEKHRAQWSSTLETYAFPIIGVLPVDRVTVNDVVTILQPIWTTKAPTAGNLRGRIDKVLGWATAMQYRSGDNPAARDGPLSHLLPSLSKVKRQQKHHAAVPYQEVPIVVDRIMRLSSISSKALLFTILTAVRTSETLGATWSEIDLTQKLWTIPAERMKADREHRVPLAPAVITLLEQLPRTGDHIFAGAKGKALSNLAMLMCLRGIRPDATVHGFRSSFSTWAREQTDYSPEIIEAALAHTQPNKVVAAYARTTYFDRRRELIADWAAHCCG